MVRDIDDGVGRFAAERTVALWSPGKKRVLLFRGTWRDVKNREEDPQVEVAFDTVAQGVIARVTPEPEQKKGLKSYIGDLLSQIVTVAALVVAYHWWREIPLDNALVAAISVGGGVVWSAIGYFAPKGKDHGLEAMVRRALEPLAAAEADEADEADDDGPRDQPTSEG